VGEAWSVEVMEVQGIPTAASGKSRWIITEQAQPVSGERLAVYEFNKQE